MIESSYGMREMIEAGATQRETAEPYGINPSVAVIWAQRLKETGSILANATVSLHWRSTRKFLRGLAQQSYCGVAVLRTTRL